MSDEVNKIKERYQKRKQHSFSQYSTYTNFIVKKRQKKYKGIICSKFDDVSRLKLIEIGAGGGGNLDFFKELEILPQNIYANELLEDRVQVLEKYHNDVHILPGDAIQIDSNLDNYFDVVFQSTVFTSILDIEFKKTLADKMWKLLKPGGIILWYDFQFDNPKNKDVKGVKKKEIIQLFPQAKKFDFSKTTLAPPIGRRVGKLYPIFNGFPFLKTHLIAVIEKD